MRMLLKELKLADIRVSPSERSFFDENNQLRYLAQTLTIFDARVIYYWSDVDVDWYRCDYLEHHIRLGKERETLKQCREEMDMRLAEKEDEDLAG